MAAFLEGVQRRELLDAALALSQVRASHVRVCFQRLDWRLVCFRLPLQRRQARAALALVWSELRPVQWSGFLEVS
ncbi:hypothetical protein [Mumia zhuanghuii]|uniref:Uncharacterized protein n=1 Tax=Mumia zhuanghuii TaxID=2585211 RepID=A0A5C4M5V3_9ACTN|nr:hypothetical protein [Mumia zhuanghuii]TNC26011.1 hypothetical protein FHE65_34750 [Mumia zhuanghuii]